MYTHPFFITAPVSNNAFSFAKRAAPRIYVPSVIDGSLSDVRVGSEVVFEDFDERDVLQSCRGLEHFVRMVHPTTGKPVYIVDNHNHVFFFWYEWARKNGIARDAVLVHIDGHKDTRVPERWMSREEAADLSKIAEYTNTVLNVGNYIPAAQQEGLVGRLISVTSEAEMLANVPEAHKSLIVNVDLDFWAPEMDYIPSSESLVYARKWMPRADLITFSTSPFFIDQARAIEVLHKLFI